MEQTLDKRRAWARPGGREEGARVVPGTRVAAVRPAPRPLEPSDTEAWLRGVRGQVEAALAELLILPDEAPLGRRWRQAMEQARGYSLRPAKRVRPALMVAGYCLGRGAMTVPVRLWRFAAGLELLHTFLLIHDDVADQAELRRGGPALHRLLGSGRAGENLAVVVGDHLFSRSLEVMLSTGLWGAAEATRYYLAVCRHTAAGQHLDLELARAPLAEVRLLQALRVAQLKTARYGFCAPLVCGAMLAGADARLREALERVGRHVGLAFQLRDDLIGLFGDERVSGKAGDGDFMQGKRTFPVLAAYTRAPAAAREELERLWALPPEAKDAAALARARALVEAHGGRAACERLVERATRAGRRALCALPGRGGARDLLDTLFTRLAGRTA